MAPLAGMSKHWTAASAQLPQGWEISGVVKGPRQADLAIHGLTWTAWAASDGQRERRNHRSAAGADERVGGASTMRCHLGPPPREFPKWCRAQRI
jgi:hypothetical protein